MKRLSVFVLLFLVLLSSSSIGSPAYLPAFGRFAILIHDVSPGYLPQLEEITALIDEYGFQNETYLFVIPNHGGEMPMWRYKAFMNFLKGLESEGYHIELHGYTHVGDEFNCNASTANRKLELGLKALSYLNVTPKYFIAPRYSLSKDALSVILAHNITVIGEDFIYLPNGTVEPIYNREYTWYLPRLLLPYELSSAESVYLNINGTFFLSLHPKAVNSGAGMDFLKAFLEYAAECKNSEGRGLG
jgi:predicted deacetylase